MTFEKLKNIIKTNKIPDDVKLLSDSGWEYNATDMNGVYYNKELNVIVFTQSCSKYEDYDPRNEFVKYKGYVPLIKGK